HPVTQEFRDGIKTLKIDVIKEDGFPMPEWSVEAHKEFMAEAKIDYTVLSPATPHVYNGDNKKAREVARKVNQSIAKICRENPDSFVFVACVPLPDVKGAIEETKYAMDKLGAVGVKLSTNN
ncbi:MAG: amidohydrolase family protein, partial [Candidatus Riflebacteria bacterium]|nr:amidohydrolase family protein [Candidatus Riflebacteria bacterium]